MVGQSLVAFLLLGLAQPALGQSCADPALPAAERLLTRARTLASEPSEAYAMHRDSIMHIAAVPRDSVALVTGDSICQRARAAYNAVIEPKAGKTVQVYVFRIQRTWLVVDPLRTNGGSRIAILFDSSWTQKSTGAIGM